MSVRELALGGRSRKAENVASARKAMLWTEITRTPATSFAALAVKCRMLAYDVTLGPRPEEEELAASLAADADHGISTIPNVGHGTLETLDGLIAEKLGGTGAAE
jgi:hypothetical protein